MNFKASILYLLGLFLLLFGNREIFQNLLNNYKKEKEQNKIHEVELTRNKFFETQTLEYNKENKNLRNPYLYIQTVHLGSIDFKSLNKASRIESGNLIENASESL